MAARRLSATSAISLDHDVTPGTDGNPNVFDDEYAASFAPSSRSASIGRSDARRPSPAIPDQISTPLPPVRTSNPELNQLSPDQIQPASDVSRKNEEIEREESNSDSETTLTGPQPSDTPNIAQSEVGFSAHRTMSSASSFSFARSQSPFQGEGPSHPYGMYPQGLGVSRSASVATASTTAGPARGYSRTPAHPYAMYPQGVAPESTDGNQTNSIPVGFPGLSTNTHFHRRVGPEGEEQDIVGIDGHTEQLPPYSRYPEEYAPKFGGGAPLPAIGETLSGMNESPTSGDEEEISPTRQPQQRSETHILSSETSADSSGPSSRNEKSWSEKNWKEKRKTKVFGMPVWLLILLFVLIIIIACVTGAVVGAFVSKQVAEKGRPPAPESTPYTEQATITTTLYDATPVPSPTDLAPPPLGTFEVILGEAPKKALGKCVTQYSQRSAWSCSIPFPSVEIVISQTMDKSNIIALPPAFNNSLRYGPQIPVVPPQPLLVMKDLDEMDLNEAYHFQALYDKLVIVPEQFLVATDRRQRGFANAPGANKNFFDEVDITQDHPWYCFWNDTFIEGFIFMSENINPAVDHPAVPSTIPQYTPTSTSTPMSSSPQTPQTSGTGWSATATKSRYPTPGFGSSSQGSFPPSPTPHGFANRAFYGWYKPTELAKYMKLEERRLPPKLNSAPPNPYCIKMQYNEYHQPVPFMDPADPNAQISVSINEFDPAPLPPKVSPGSSKRHEQRQQMNARRGERLPLAPRSTTAPNGGDDDRWGPYQPEIWEDGCYCQWSNSDHD